MSKLVKKVKSAISGKKKSGAPAGATSRNLTAAEIAGINQQMAGGRNQDTDERRRRRRGIAPYTLLGGDRERLS